MKHFDVEAVRRQMERNSIGNVYQLQQAITQATEGKVFPSYNSVKHLLTGRNLASAKLLAALAATFGCSIDDLFTEEPDGNEGRAERTGPADKAAQGDTGRARQGK